MRARALDKITTVQFVSDRETVCLKTNGMNLPLCKTSEIEKVLLARVSRGKDYETFIRPVFVCEIQVGASFAAQSVALSTDALSPLLP